MITVRKGNDEIVCTKDTYEDQYKRLGYQIVSNIKKEAIDEIASLNKEKIVEDSQKEMQEEKEQEQIENQKIVAKYGFKKGRK